MVAIPVDSKGYTQEELLEMSREEAIEGLPIKAQRFCEFYVEGFNRRMALKRAGYESCDCTYSYRLFQKQSVQRYIMWLKARILNVHMVNAVDLIDQWIRIAFSDMTDFVNIHPGYITLKPASEVDGQLIKSIKSGRDGVSIELHDKLKALDCLSKYIDDMPKDWKQKLEERKVELLEEEFKLKKKVYELENPQQKDDGLIEAIKESAKVIWEEPTE